MKGKKYLVKVILAIGFSFLNLEANNGAGSCSFTFLKIPMDARTVALGEATTAVTNGVFALCSNPAGISEITYNEISATYLNYLAGIQSGYFGLALPFWQNYSFGLGLTYFNYGKIQETTPDNPTGEGLGKYGAMDLALHVGIAKKFEKWRAGLVLKGIYSRIHDYSAHAIALDIGIQYEILKEYFLAGYAIRNLGVQTGAFIEEITPLPITFETGIGWKILRNSLLLTLDFGKPLDNRFYLETGVEYSLRDILFFRLGYRSSGSDLKTGSDIDFLCGFSAGIGAIIKNYGIDYAFIPSADLGNTHRISAKIKFGEQDGKN